MKAHTLAHVVLGIKLGASQLRIQCFPSILCYLPGFQATRIQLKLNPLGTLGSTVAET